jgi:aryl-alcohol dehydrogenase-like predicted oxidoreductase
MRYKLLGNSGLRVSELCLGTMAFGEDWGWGASREECGRVVDAFAEAGGNVIDTADNYTGGTAERYVGELIAPERDRWVLATKYTLSRDTADPNGAGNHRKSLVHALEASLERLNTDYVDVLWVHIWDFLTPIEEVMRALDDQVRAGKVLYLGMSDTPAWIIARANAIAAQHGWTPFVAAQAQYSLVERTVEREVAPMARALDLALLAWSPLGMGVLTGKYDDAAAASTEGARLNRPDTAGAAFLTERNLAIARVVREVATELDASPAQVSLAWVLSRPGVVLPIVGARKESQIRDNLGALAIELSAEQLVRLDAVSAIDLGFPQAFINEVRRTPVVLGDALDRIDDHRAERSGLPLGSSVRHAGGDVEAVE